MSSQEFPTGYPVKPAPQAGVNPAQTGSSSGRLFGCAAIGCGSIVLLAMVTCGVGYWAIFYSSAPLRLVEQGLEQEGFVEIEGMTGNISTGVEVEKVRFREDRASEEWSEMTGLEVKYKTTGPVWNRNGFVIEKINVASARFLVDLDEDVDLSGDFDMTGVLDQIADNSAGQLQGGDLQNGNFEIQQVLFQNITLVDRDSANEIKIDEVRFEGLSVKKGELVHLGDITVQSDMLEIRTLPSEAFADRKINQRYEIRLKEAASPVLVADLPLSIDVGYTSPTQINTRIDALQNQVQFSPGDKTTAGYLTFDAYQPGDFFSPDKLGVVAASVNAGFERQPGKNQVWQLVGDGGTVQLGQTRFDFQPGESASPDGLVFVTTATVDGHPVTATARFAGRLPLVNLSLSSGAEWDESELWARTVFGESFSDLDNTRQKAIVRTTDLLKQQRDLQTAKDQAASEGELKAEGDPESDDDSVSDKSDSPETSDPVSDPDPDGSEDQQNGASENSPAAVLFQLNQQFGCCDPAGEISVPVPA